MNNNTKKYYNSKQGRLPLFISDRLDICDPVLAFDKIMEEIEIEKYLKPEPLRFPAGIGRPVQSEPQNIFKAVISYIQTAEGIDLQHLYLKKKKHTFVGVRGKYALFMAVLTHVYKNGRAVEKWN